LTVGDWSKGLIRDFLERLGTADFAGVGADLKKRLHFRDASDDSSDSYKLPKRRPFDFADGDSLVALEGLEVKGAVQTVKSANQNGGRNSLSTE
jgi:hypothetical protein